MQAGWPQPRVQRRATYWLLVLGTTAFVSVEPALFLVLLAVGLSALALTWIVLLARLLLIDAIAALRQARHAAAGPTDPTPQ